MSPSSARPGAGGGRGGNGRAMGGGYLNLLCNGKLMGGARPGELSEAGLPRRRGSGVRSGIGAPVARLSSCGSCSRSSPRRSSSDPQRCTGRGCERTRPRGPAAAPLRGFPCHSSGGGSTSRARCARSSPSTASPATGPTPPLERRTCGSTSRRTPPATGAATPSSIGRRRTRASCCAAARGRAPRANAPRERAPPGEEEQAVLRRWMPRGRPGRTTGPSARQPGRPSPAAATAPGPDRLPRRAPRGGGLTPAPEAATHAPAA